MQALAAQLATVAGCPVEITHRGGESFTFSTEQRNDAAAAKLAAFFAKDKRAAVKVEHDDECGSFVYLDIVQ